MAQDAFNSIGTTRDIEKNLPDLIALVKSMNARLQQAACESYFVVKKAKNDAGAIEVYRGFYKNTDNKGAAQKITAKDLDDLKVAFTLSVDEDSSVVLTKEFPQKDVVSLPSNYSKGDGDFLNDDITKHMSNNWLSHTEQMHIR